ncbi:probable L-type lectin-domain containing receptor kinase S.5 isoform X2 [Typha angustifolia]|uniref:probable L-type lectin-domain containing receptor kinase S.5 isoform X2 n=1 Tax=Typha angustifolia TaxID=59011 RepID=UPI003C2B8A2B
MVDGRAVRISKNRSLSVVSHMMGVALQDLLHHPVTLLISILLLLLHVHLAQSQLNSTTKEYFSYSFSSFDESDGKTRLTVLPNARIYLGALQITPDTINNPSYLVNKSGQVFYSQPFKLWEYTNNPNSTNTTTTTTTYVASFNTSFNVNIYRPDNSTPGEGFAFVIAPSLNDPLPGSDGGFLGLTNATYDGNATNNFVAVEFDTVKQSYDSDNNHVGLNINGVRSKVSNSLTPYGIQIAPMVPANYTVWIDYNGTSRYLFVYMDAEGRPKPSSTVLNHSLDLASILKQRSYFGFSASTGTTYELNCVLAWNMTVEKLAEDKGGTSKWKIGLIIGVPAAALALLIGLLFGLYMRRRRVGDDSSVLTGTLIRSLPGTPREFKYKQLKKATNNFEEKMKLGQGGFGVVYKGVLLGDNGENIEVAVKKFSRANTCGQDDFLSELSIINRLRHKNLVRLVGWCHKNGMLLLVYDYMPNGSLDQHIFGGPEKPLLTWDCRCNIVVDVASALHYLHNEYDQKVVHRDLKASNVMLDSAFNARLGDFGLARALETDKTSYSEVKFDGVPGTPGYLAPECFHTGKFTRESDIFGFGAVVLEVVCGRRPRCQVGGFESLSDWVWKLYREGRIEEAVDRRLNGSFDLVKAERLLLLGLACSHPIPRERPKAETIVQILSGSVPPPPVPLFKPPFVWPAAAPIDLDAEDETTTTGTTTGTATQLTCTEVTSSSYSSSSEKYVSVDNNITQSDVSMV